MVVLPTLECGGGGGGRYLEMARTCRWGWWVAGSWGPVPATWPHRQGSMCRGLGRLGGVRGVTEDVLGAETLLPSPKPPLKSFHTGPGLVGSPGGVKP